MIHRAELPFEAPNWTPDGSALIFNGSGRGENRGKLYRFDLATRQPVAIDTGTSNRNNNDHVLSFDGTMLGISDQSAGAVRHLHRSGRRRHAQADHAATPLVSPRLVARRQVAGLHRRPQRRVRHLHDRVGRVGTEKNLTNSKGLDDGPEYTPDGSYIYFNSVRGGGTMQIWRMKPDGTQPEQVTNDDLNNWFPHISPDGQWIAFISFPKDVDPTDHPYYKRVYLRLMPVGGGAQGDRLRARRPGHDQRAVLVARREDARFRQQYRRSG